MVSDSAGVSRSPELSPSVGQHRLSDSEREAAIHRAGDLFLHYMAKYDLTGDFQYRGQADRVLGIQRELIFGRSAEQVSKMEREIGLA